MLREKSLGQSANLDVVTPQAGKAFGKHCGGPSLFKLPDHIHKSRAVHRDARNTIVQEWARSYSISVSDDGILNMTAESGEGISKFFGVKSSGEQSKISLQVPSDLLASLEIHTTNEDISVASLRVADKITLSNNNGDISFDKLAVGNSLQIDNKNGNISGSVAGSYDEFAISTESKKGENNLPDAKEGGNKTLNVTNNNDDIDIEFISD